MRPAEQSRLRRVPRQRRSQAMVERIVTAGREVLVTHGYEGASTNRIAAALVTAPLPNSASQATSARSAWSMVENSLWRVSLCAVASLFSFVMTLLGLSHVHPGKASSALR